MENMKPIDYNKAVELFNQEQEIFYKGLKGEMLPLSVRQGSVSGDIFETDELFVEITDLYYIRNEGYLGNALIWWGKEGNGYTPDILKAEKYTKERAESICKRPQDTAYKCSYIDNLHESHKLIIDSQYVKEENRLWKAK